jgi:hypothetical protein
MERRNMRQKSSLTAAIVLLMLLAVLLPGVSPPIVSSAPATDAEEPRYSAELDQLRQELAASGRGDVTLVRADYITTPAGFHPATSQTLVTNDRTHLLGVQFVPNDPRRDGRSFITYVVDQSDGTALTLRANNTVTSFPNATTESVIDQTMAKWETDTGCTGPALVKVADSGANIDVADDLGFGRRPLGVPIADITHGGWINRSFFNIIAPGGADYVLAVAIFWAFLDQDGNPTDIDKNGRYDLSFVEIYYNRGFGWSPNGEQENWQNIDIESIVKHESGHALGLNHFGKVFLTKNGSNIDDVHFAPRAVMNAVYVLPFRELTGTDKASFCHLWASAN